MLLIQDSEKSSQTYSLIIPRNISKVETESAKSNTYVILLCKANMKMKFIASIVNCF